MKEYKQSMFGNFSPFNAKELEMPTVEIATNFAPTQIHSKLHVPKKRPSRRCLSQGELAGALKRQEYPRVGKQMKTRLKK
jgi:hypothetical protein